MFTVTVQTSGIDQAGALVTCNGVEKITPASGEVTFTLIDGVQYAIGATYLTTEGSTVFKADSGNCGRNYRTDLMDLTKAVLPDSVVVSGRSYKIHTGHSYWFRFFQILEQEKKYLTDFDFLYVDTQEERTITTSVQKRGFINRLLRKKLEVKKELYGWRLYPARPTGGSRSPCRVLLREARTPEG